MSKVPLFFMVVVAIIVVAASFAMCSSAGKNG
jgi:hypothetical protein